MGIERTKDVTVEFYGDPLGIKLVGAVNVNKARMNEHAERLGKLICKLRGVNQLEAVIVDEDGEEIDRITVFR